MQKIKHFHDSIDSYSSSVAKTWVKDKGGGSTVKVKGQNHKSLLNQYKKYPKHSLKLTLGKVKQ